ncbi:MAG: glycosyltransferase family 4 protein [ANME-2 cluster archaeon]|nr:glycosyltransferase family 4 protein [ANME-2 cluster archaeon]
MTTVNYVIDNGLVNRLTTQRKWLDSYIPSVVERVEKLGIDVVFDRDTDFDVMHIHIPMTLAYRLSMNNNDNNGSHKPSIFHGHMTEDTFFVGGKVKYFIRRWFRSIAQRSDVILCPSVSAAEYYRNILPDADIRQLNYGIDLNRYAYSKHDGLAFRQRYGIEEEKTVISCVGGVLQRKGVDDLCEIAARFPDFLFMWVGGSFYKNKGINSLYGMISREDNMDVAKVPENVLFTDYTLDVPAALSASDIFFFPSRHETQGLALVEAAANSRPIVTRDLPVFREWLNPGHDCLMGMNVDEFAAHIKSLTDDQGLAKRIGQEACQSARKHHDINRASASLAGIYRELAG